MGIPDAAPDSPATVPTSAVAPDLGRALRAIDLALLAVAAASGIGVAAGLGTGLPALVSGAGWLLLQRSRAGRWLRSVRRLEGARAAALVRTGLARAEHRRGNPSAMMRAGDAYEREGRMRSALRERGAEPSRTVGWLLPIAERLGLLR